MTDIREICKKTAGEINGIDLFCDVNLDGILIPDVLANDEMGFIIKYAEKDSKLLSEYWEINNARNILAEKEPEAEIFGLLVLDDCSGIEDNFLSYAQSHKIYLVEPDKIGTVIRKQLNKKAEQEE